MVGQRTEIPIDLSESGTSELTGETFISDVLANRGIVLALNKAVVVLFVRTRTGETNRGGAELVDGPIDELTTGIGVNAEKGKSQRLTNVMKAVTDPSLRFVQQSTQFDPL